MAFEPPQDVKRVAFLWTREGIESVNHLQRFPRVFRYNGVTYSAERKRDGSPFAHRGRHTNVEIVHYHPDFTLQLGDEVDVFDLPGADMGPPDGTDQPASTSGSPEGRSGAAAPRHGERGRRRHFNRGERNDAI